MDHHHITFTRRTVLSLIAVGTAVLAKPSLAQNQTDIRVWKDPGCGCCGAWVENLRRSGFAPLVTDTTNMHAIKAQFGVPAALASCHTARVGDYVIEGHVPAPAIIELLAQRPAGLGLAVPGMPPGSPGMEGASPEIYDVILFGSGMQTSYARFMGSRRI